MSPRLEGCTPKTTKSPKRYDKHLRKVVMEVTLFSPSHFPWIMSYLHDSQFLDKVMYLFSGFMVVLAG